LFVIDYIIRIFADDPPSASRPSRLDIDRSSALQHLDDTILYSDVTAAVYQEWNVIKKNKFGRMQERIIGIDAHKVYNAKRDSQSSSVSRAHRDISTIRKVEMVENDSIAFRITFVDERETYDVEYTCDNPRACAEIVAKLNYLLAVREKEPI
jgi:hypothetical protein